MQNMINEALIILEALGVPTSDLTWLEAELKYYDYTKT